MNTITKLSSSLFTIIIALFLFTSCASEGSDQQTNQQPDKDCAPDIMLAFGVDSQATTVGVNRDGYIEFKRSNTALSEEEYRELFDSLVAG